MTAVPMQALTPETNRDQRKPSIRRKKKLLAVLEALCTLALAVTAAHAGVPTAPKPDVPALSQRIDQEIGKRLQEEGIKPSALADDAEFLRRVYLDITGVIPSADKAAAFLDSKQPDKRARLIDELLANPNYGRHMGDIWQDLLMAQRDILSKYLQLDPLTNWFAQG